MSSVIIRFPDGTREFRYPERPLAEGDVIQHDGQRYGSFAPSATGLASTPLSWCWSRTGPGDTPHPDGAFQLDQLNAA